MAGAPRNLIGRMQDSARHFLWDSRFYNLMLRGPHPHSLVLAPIDPWPVHPPTAEALAQGSILWDEQRIASFDPRGWPTELHSFFWLRHATALGEARAKPVIDNILKRWLDVFDEWEEQAWAPDILARRLIAWMRLGRLILGGADLVFRSRVLNSMARQARHLARTVTDAPDGAPLLMAISGLIHSGICLPEGPARLQRGLDRLNEELGRQIQADGSLLTRNPSDHLAALMDLVDLRDLLLQTHHAEAQAIQLALDRLAPMVRFFRHGDGGLALFNGGNEDDPELIDFALAKAEAKGRPLAQAKQAGFQRVQCGKTLLVLDAGIPGTPWNAHAGTLSFELSHGRSRIIVNCGGAQHEPWRQLARTTAAHSTVVVADTNSSIIREDGLLARRARDVVSKRTESDDAITVEAGHDGYSPRYGLLHRRHITLSRDGLVLAGEDHLFGPATRKRAGLPIDVRFHLHPSIEAVALAGEGALLRLPTGRGWMFHAQGGSVSVQESIYLGERGKAAPTKQLVISTRLEDGRTIVNWKLERSAARDLPKEGEEAITGSLFDADSPNNI